MCNPFSCPTRPSSEPVHYLSLLHLLQRKQQIWFSTHFQNLFESLTVSGDPEPMSCCLPRQLTPPFLFLNFPTDLQSEELRTPPALNPYDRIDIIVTTTELSELKKKLLYVLILRIDFLSIADERKRQLGPDAKCLHG